jgi:Tfp pilus assembly protein PilN
MAESNSSWLSERLAPLAGPMYVIAALLIVTPLGDFFSGVWPWRPAALDWRFASSGLLSGFLLTPLLGALIAIGIAALVGNGRLLRVFGLLTLIAGGLCVVILGGFLLDVVQLKSSIPPQQQRPFLDASIKAFLKYALAAASSIWLGMRAYGLGRWKQSQRATAQRDTIVIGGASSVADPLIRQGSAR